MIERALSRLAPFSVGHPWPVIGLTVLATLAFAVQLPRITIDTDPKHMLPATSPVRQYNDQVEKEFVLHADVMALPRHRQRAGDLTVMARRLEGGAAGMIPSSAPR